MKNIRISNKLWAIIVKKTKVLNAANPQARTTPQRWAAEELKAAFDPYIGTVND